MAIILRYVCWGTHRPPPPLGAWRLTARPANPQGLGRPRGGWGSPPPPYSPQKLSHTPRGHTLAGGGPCGAITPPPYQVTPLQRQTRARAAGVTKTPAPHCPCYTTPARHRGTKSPLGLHELRPSGPFRKLPCGPTTSGVQLAEAGGSSIQICTPMPGVSQYLCSTLATMGGLLEGGRTHRRSARCPLLIASRREYLPSFRTLVPVRGVGVLYLGMVGARALSEAVISCHQKGNKAISALLLGVSLQLWASLCE